MSEWTTSQPGLWSWLLLTNWGHCLGPPEPPFLDLQMGLPVLFINSSVWTELVTTSGTQSSGERLSPGALTWPSVGPPGQASKRLVGAEWGSLGPGAQKWTVANIYWVLSMCSAHGFTHCILTTGWWAQLISPVYRWWNGDTKRWSLTARKRQNWLSVLDTFRLQMPCNLFDHHALRPEGSSSSLNAE